MKNFNSLEKRTVRHVLLTACAAALAVAFMVAPLQTAYAADTITPPRVPDNLKVPDGSKVFLVGHAIGTQNYVCLPSGSGVAFVLFTPQATLFGEDGGQIITHFFSPNLSPKPIPGFAADAVGTVRATWQDSQDSSRFWGEAEPGKTSTDSNFVADGAIAWVLLQRAGVQKGPTGGDRLTSTMYVQRVNTAGGLAPKTGCASSTDIGHLAFMPYRADYFFFH